eukprot:scaffold43851_cov40-Cyclotella_meneghiniana.AAC.6
MLAATAEVETEVADVVVEAAMNAVAIVRTTQSRILYEGIPTYLVHDNNSGIELQPVSEQLLTPSQRCESSAYSVDSSHKHRYHISTLFKHLVGPLISPPLKRVLWRWTDEPAHGGPQQCFLGVPQLTVSFFVGRPPPCYVAAGVSR